MRQRPVDARDGAEQAAVSGLVTEFETTSGRGADAVDVVYAGPAGDAERVAGRLECERADFAVDAATESSAVLSAVDDVDCVVAAERLEDGDAIDLLRSLRERDPDLPVVLVPERGDESLAADAVAAGATDYLPREDGDVPFSELADCIESSVEAYREARKRRRERAFLEQLQGTIADSTVVVDRDGQVVWANETAADRFGIGDGGYRIGDVPVYDEDGEFVRPDERPYVRVFTTGEPVEEFRCQVPVDGERRWLSVNAEPVALDGELRYVAVSAEDVTDRVRDRRQLEASREELATELREVFERVSDAFFALDDQWRFTYVNETASRLVGVDGANVVGERIWDVFEGAADTRFEAQCREAMATQDPVSFEEYYPPQDAWFEVRTYPSSSGLSVYFRDVTDRKEREGELQRRASQQAAVTDLGRAALEGRPLDALLEEATRLVADRLDTDFAKALDYRPSEGDLLLRSGVGWDDGYVGQQRVPSSRDSQAGYVLESRDPVVTENLDDEDRFDPEPLLTDHGATSGVSVVVGSIENPWGVLGAHDGGERSFTQDDVNFVQGVANVLAASIESRRRRRELRETSEVFREMYGVAADRTLTFEAKLDRLLDLGRTFLGLELGAMTEASGGVQSAVALRGDHPDLADGDEWSLDDGYCTETLEDGFHAVRAAGEEYDDLPARTEFGFEAYVGSELRVDGDAYGTVFFADTSPREEPYDDVERAFVELVSQWLSFELERQHRQWDLERTERQFEAAFDNPSSFMAILDPDGTVRQVNEVALDFVDADHEDVAGDPFPETPWWDHSPALQQRLRTWIQRVRDGEYVRFEEEHRSPDGETVTVDGVFQPVTDADGEVVAIFVSGLDVSERTERERQLERQRERLDALNDINSLVHNVAEAVVRESSREEIERLVCTALAESDSYEFAWVGEVDEAREEVRSRVQVGDPEYDRKLRLRADESPGAEGPTVTAMRTGEMQVVTDVADDPEYGPWRERALAHGYRSSAAVPITYEDALYGVLNIYSGRTDAFGAEERAAFERLGTIVAHAIRSVERERQLRESERRYRTLAENVPNGSVTLVDTDRRYQLVAGETYEDIDLDPEDLEGKRIGEVSALPEGSRQQVAEAYERALDGEEVSTEVEYEGRTYAHHALPVEEHGEIHGAMSLSQDITERVRREAELEHERERLELLNRLIRHNLLNSLNVVDARLGLVEGHVDYEVAEHLGTAADRTREMIDLIGTIRALMRAIDDEEDQHLEPVALADLVESEAEDAADAHPGAEFETGDLPDVAVRADDLLGEVVENLLVNGVQHNDAATPEVRVDVDVRPGAGTAVVEVADNGSGVPEDLRETIFEKGTKGFESPGTGFGLHLVREIVDAYGGSVDVDDADDGGARFRVELPLA